MSGQPTPVKFERTINLGHLLTAASFAVGCASTIFFVGQGIGTLTAQLAANERSTTARFATLDERAARYIPKVDQLQSTSDLQQDRIQAQAAAIADIRNAQLRAAEAQASNQQRVFELLNQVRVDVAKLTVRFEVPVPGYPTTTTNSRTR